MIDQKLKELVVKEALNLRKYATKKEIRNLNLKTLNIRNSCKCIYGQLTGDYFSDRSKFLMNKSVKKYITVGCICDTPIEFYLKQSGAKTELLIKLIKS